MRENNNNKTKLTRIAVKEIENLIKETKFECEHHFIGCVRTIDILEKKYKN